MRSEEEIIQKIEAISENSQSLIAEDARIGMISALIWVLGDVHVFMNQTPTFDLRGF